MVRRMDRQCEVLIGCRNGTEVNELLQAGASRHKKGTARCSVRVQVLEDGRVLAREARNWKIQGQKEEENDKRNT